MSRNPVLVVAVLGLFALAAQAQSPASSDETGHPSNGVLEMTLAPMFPQVMGPRRPGSVSRLQDGVWDGTVEVTLKNISNLRVHWEAKRWAAAYDLEVFDAEGRPVPLTPFGDGAVAAKHSSSPLLGVQHTSPIDLEPSQSTTDVLPLGAYFQIKRSQTYTIKVRRSRDLPQFDQLGRPLAGLSATLVVKGGPGGSDAPVY